MAYLLVMSGGILRLQDRHHDVVVPPPVDARRLTLDALPHAALGEVTANGLTGRELVVHVASQESLLAQLVGVPTLEAVTETDIEERTAATIEAPMQFRMSTRNRSCQS